MWILGGYQSDFARNLTREGHDFAALTAEVVDATLATAKLDAAGIEVVHVGNAFGEMFARQGHLGAMPATVCDGLWDTPASRHEAACASGSVAALAAMADLRSGAYDTALVVGIELEKTVPGDTAAQHLGPRHGPVTRGPTRATCGRPCSPGWPTSTTAGTDWTMRTCGPSPSSTSPTPAATPTPRPAGGPSPIPSPTTTTPTRSPRAGCDASTAAK
ncbi:thiolase, N-terminal domain protein [Mycobacterium intracellulare 1956]|uniref:Thiolase, N-terminal domain protein n=1 Tax=Mycobacterium intracellulare 1956 TaxID=1299331 RepID=X8CNF9_MYCIT|nr:thiolase, N-terminal domain protein [Mycobacterium intracellulare 1956]